MITLSTITAFFIARKFKNIVAFVKGKFNIGGTELEK
ncbi:hypothetical protein WGH24286_01532 [Periweissella ghanensis]|uniref:Uncharacterized protein n=1 Tax=Periweissella ghanensis TaxID=467997 RepID=A0ABM8ZEG2_9LACO|nr:hypothetical protein WGH24286_01532 [Periweissella ghanensis]